MPFVRRNLLVTAVTTLVLAVPAAGLDAAADGSTPVSSAPVAKTQYAVNDPVCAQPTDPHAMRCYALKRTTVAKGTRGAYKYTPAAAAGPSGGMTPSTLATAYRYNPKVNRSDLTVAIVLWHDSPNVLSDLNRFDAQYKLPKETSTSFRKVNQDGKASPLPARDRDVAGEIAMDTQAVRGVCNTCRILLVEADNPSADSLATAVNTAVRLGAKVVSNSYGVAEYPVDASAVRAYKHPGVVMTVATGDAGWYGWDYDNDSANSGDGAASFPSTLPTVVSVGGTTLNVDAAGARTGETVWNGDGPHNSAGTSRHRSLGASGGGCSKYYPATSWQAHTTGYPSANCHGKRLAADVALDADPSTGLDVYDSYGSGGWATIGGTSLSAPLAAGMYALAGGANGADYPSSALYTNASLYANTRYDVHAGGNGFCASDSTATCSAAVYQPTLLNPGTHNPNNLGLGLVDCSYPRTGADANAPKRIPECNAIYGFDGPSGVGTPGRIGLFARTDPSVGIALPSSPAHGRSATYTAVAHYVIPKTSFLSFVWSWGDGTSASTRSGRIAHTYKKAGKYLVTLTVTDSRYQQVVRQKTVTVR